MFRALGWRFSEDYKRIASICDGVDDALQRSCYQQATKDAVRTRGVAAGVALCTHTPTSLAVACVESVVALAGAYTEKDTAARDVFCQDVPTDFMKRCLAVENK